MPSLREKKRYLAFEVITDGNPASHEVDSSIRRGLLRYLGTLGTAKAGASVMKDQYDTQSRKGIIRVAHTSTDQVSASLALINEVGSRKAMIRTVGASGILKKARDNYLKKDERC